MAFEPLKVQVDATRKPVDGEKHGSYWEVLQYAWNAADPTIYVAASETHPVAVLEVVHVVETAFTATATIDIGDGTDADLYIDQTDINVDADNNATTSLLATTPPGVQHYTANFQITATVAGTVSAGAGKLMAHLIRF